MGIDRIIIDSSKITQYNKNNFTTSLIDVIKKGKSIKLIGGFIEKNTDPKYYKIIFEGLNNNYDSNNGIINFIIINNANGNYVFINEANQINLVNYFANDTKTFNIKIYDSDGVLHNFSNDFLLIFEVL
jgi:hypothetical protein